MTALCLNTSVPAETLIDAAYCMNKNLVFAMDNFKCIKGIRLKTDNVVLFPPVESTLVGEYWTSGAAR